MNSPKVYQGTESPGGSDTAGRAYLGYIRKTQKVRTLQEIHNTQNIQDIRTPYELDKGRYPRHGIFEGV